VIFLSKQPQPVDIIVVTFNRLRYLEKTLESIVQNTRYPYRLIVVDNASSDGTRKWLKDNKKRLGIDVLLLRTVNVGVAKARMIGLKHTRSPIVACSDDDAWYNPGWLTECMRILEAFPDVAVATVDKFPGKDSAKNNLGRETRKGVTVILKGSIRPYSMVFRKAPVMECGGFQIAKGQVMGFMGSRLCRSLRRHGWRIARSEKRWRNEHGKMEWLVCHMDVVGGDRSHRDYYDQTGYTHFRSLAKRGKAHEFKPRKVD